jgi:predicted metal-dependent hydrolase
MHNPAYLEGIRLFNAGHFWHAHEQWEECWRQAGEPDATFYKGIIQAAAALVHWQKGNPRGLRLNWAKSRRRLAGLPPRYMGLDLAALIVALDDFAARAPNPSQPAPQLAFEP